MSFKLSKIFPPIDKLDYVTLIYLIVLLACAIAFMIVLLLSPNIYKETLKELPKANSVEELIIVDYNAQLDNYATCRAVKDYLREEHENNHFVKYEIYPRHCLNIE